MAVLDGVMLGIALPAITVHFNIGIAQSQWVITGYLIASAGLYVFFGKLSDYIGKIKLYIAGWVLFIVSSLLCGLAPGMNELIMFRIIQGIGASMVAGVATAIVFHAFPPQERGKSMGMLAASAALGALIGPGFGGLVVDAMGWQSIFFINIPVGIVLLVLAFKYLKMPEITSKNIKIDWVGTAALFVSIASLILVCVETGNSASISLPIIAYGIVFAISTLGFIAYESSCKNPILDLSVFGNRMFTLPLVGGMLLVIANSVPNILAPFYFQGVMGYSASQVGLLFMIQPLIMFIMAPFGGWLYDKKQWKYSASAGAIIMAASFLLLAYSFYVQNIWAIVLSFVIWGTGMGLFLSPNTTEAMSALPREKSAVASSIMSMARSLSVALGVSLASMMTSLWLSSGGYGSTLLSIGSSAIANGIGTVTLAAGGLLIVSTIICAMRNI